MENQIPTVPTQPVVDVQQTIVPEQSKKSNFLTILLSILLFLAIVIAVFFAYQTQKLSKELNTLKLEPESTFPMYIEPNETVDDPTVDWKTYTDINKKYSYKYPSNLFPRTNTSWGYGTANYYSNENSANGETENIYEALFQINVLIQDESYSLPSKYIDSQGRTWSIDEVVGGEGDSSNYHGEIEHNGKYYILGSKVYGRNYGRYLNKELRVENDGSYNTALLAEEHAKLINQILSTFKFID